MSTDTVSASRRVQKKGQEVRGDAVLLGGVSQGRGRGGMDGKQAFFSRKVDGGPAIKRHGHVICPGSPAELVPRPVPNRLRTSQQWGEWA